MLSPNTGKYKEDCCRACALQSATKIFPKKAAFFWDERTLQNGTNFTLDTDLGDIDLLGEVSGVGDFSAVKTASVEMQICDISVSVISLNNLIKAKRAAGRAKDLLVLPELEALREVLSDEED